MPRANRHFLPGHVWHITHRCHEKKFLLKFARDRQVICAGFRSQETLRSFGAGLYDHLEPRPSSDQRHRPKRHGRSMQLIAGRTGQEYNERKGRHGAFWEDRYHATAIETDEHLHRCLVYIDLNMVRAGVVDHPVKWANSGFSEIQQAPKRYRLIDLPAVVALCGFSKLSDLQKAHRQWVDEALHGA